MAGDPCQLPPVVTAPASVTRHVAAVLAGAAAISPLKQPLPAGGPNPASGAARGAVLQGFARPLLVRLVQMGHKAHLLRTQYRQFSILYLKLCSCILVSEYEPAAVSICSGKAHCTVHQSSLHVCAIKKSHAS